VIRERLVVIGADAAGMSAASVARRMRGPEQLDIVAFDRGRFTSYSACGIPYFVGKDVAEVASLVARTPEQFAAMGIEARLGHEVVEVDTAAQTVTVRDLESGAACREGYDRLLVATGAVPFRPAVPGIDAPGVFGVQTLDDGVALRAALDAASPRRAVVVGAGYVGLELAEALCAWGAEVAVVERAGTPMSTLDPDMGVLVAEAMRRFGMEVRTEETVERIDLDRSGRARAVVTDRGILPADVVILGTGVHPNVGLAEAAGVELGPSGAIAVDPRMATNVPGVWAAGDCAEKRHLVSGRPVAIALGTHANKEGRVAGANIAGGEASFPGVLGTAVTKVCSLEVARTGLGEAEAAADGIDAVAVTTESTTRAGYYPGARPIRVKLVAEAGGGRLLGAQIVGEEGAAKRIDVAAMAIWHHMTVGEVVDVDLSYAPPFSPLWDPILIAARRTAEVLRATVA
jgi:NADPH-dependent 2,4-dienoyl-CoA reductase/sulfur reductase-like enzyme